MSWGSGAGEASSAQQREPVCPGAYPPPCPLRLGDRTGASLGSSGIWGFLREAAVGGVEERSDTRWLQTRFTGSAPSSKKSCCVPVSGGTCVPGKTIWKR